MSELKPYIGPHPTDHTLTEYYLKSEAHKVISENNKEICKLKRALCKACANRERKFLKKVEEYK